MSKSLRCARGSLKRPTEFRSDSKQYVIFTLACLVLLVGCTHSQRNGPGAKDPKGANSASGNPRDDVLAALKRLGQAYPYRLTERVTFSDTPQQSSTIRIVDYAAADQIHYRMGNYEEIRLGAKHYRLSGGKWVEVGPSGREPEIEEIIAGELKNVQAAGTGSVGGINSKIYTVEYEFTTKVDVANGTSTIWIAISDGRPLRLKSELKMRDRIKESDKLYDYNAIFKVEQPIP